MGSAVVAFRDLGGSIQQLGLATQLALDDVHGKYRRTILGPLWIMIAQTVVIAGFVVVFSGLFNRDPETYALYLAAGLPTWALFTQFLTDMPSAFISSRSSIESFELPWMTYIWRRSIGYVLLFMHNIVTLFVVMAILGERPGVEMLYVLPALLVILLAGTGVGLLFAVIGARYRDLQPAMHAITGFLFLFSPVFWHVDQLSGREWAYQYNPLYYFLTLVRDPLLGREPSADLWVGTISGAAALFVLGFTAFMLSRRRLYHWL